MKIFSNVRFALRWLASAVTAVTMVETMTAQSAVELKKTRALSNLLERIAQNGEVDDEVKGQALELIENAYIGLTSFGVLDGSNEANTGVEFVLSQPDPDTTPAPSSPALEADMIENMAGGDPSVKIATVANTADPNADKPVN